MTESGTLEDRLRRTFRAVAERPVTGISLDEIPPWERVATVGSIGADGAGGAGRSRRSVRLVGGAVAAAVVLVVVTLLVAYGPRSSTTGKNPAPATEPPGQAVHAVFAPARPVTPSVLARTATVLDARLKALGDTTATATVDHGSIDVAGASSDDIRAMAKTGAFFVRPVSCGAVPTRPADVIGLQSGPLPPCQAQYETTAANLGIDVQTGRPANTIPPDPGFASYATTTPQDDNPDATVLLGADPSAAKQEYSRFVLGPAQVDGSEIATAQAQSLGSSVGKGGWSVVITLTTTGAVQWNDVAQQNFHQFVGFDLDGAVLSAPLIQPTNSTFESFDGKIEFGTFSAAEAKGLAAVLGSGPLPVGLTLESLTTLSPALGPAPTGSAPGGST